MIGKLNDPIFLVELMGMLVAASVGPVPVGSPLPAGTPPKWRPRPGVGMSPQELLALVRWSAAQLGPLEELPTPAPGDRVYELLERTADYELWVIKWPQDTGLVLHDHGRSAGAFLVTEGTLEETSTTLRGGQWRRRQLSPHGGRCFGPEYVHGVGNPTVAQATSLHAYSPPLASMTFYRSSTAGLEVDHVETEWEGAP